MNDLSHLELVAERIAESHVDITSSFDDWTDVTFACASLGEGAREAYHLICSQYGGYTRKECDGKFDNCLRTGRGTVTLGTVMEFAKRAGIDVTMPKGRPKKSAKEKEAEAANAIADIRNALAGCGEFRYNVWTQRNEIKNDCNEWRPITERDLSTLTCRVIESGIKTTDAKVTLVLNDRAFSKDCDEVVEWLEGLPEWNPDTAPDYIHEFFDGHIVYGDPENSEFYAWMWRKWFVCKVALWLGKIDTNPIAPILVGEQHVGKSFFTQHILPPHLTQYFFEVNPSAPINKDFSIALSEKALLFLDEFAFGGVQKANTYKFVATSTMSFERDAFHHFRENRKRRASIIGATNQKQFICDREGIRRFPAVNIVATKNLFDHPLPYEGAYAQAMYLIRNGYNCKPTKDESMAITKHNLDYLEPNDCEEVLRTICVKAGIDDPNARLMTAGSIKYELESRGFKGKGYSSVEIGKALKHLGFEPIPRKNGTNYLVRILDYNEQKAEQMKQLQLLRDEVNNVVEETAAPDATETELSF